MSNGLASGLFEAFISYLYSSGSITIPSDFHERCGKISTMLDNDISGIVSTIIDYSINSSSEAILKIECSDDSLENLLNLWLSKINININGVPTGLQELSKEYYKERWAGSSLCLMRVSNWETISIGANSIKVPTVLYFVNGASVYVDRKNEKNYKLGTDKYYLDKEKKNEIPKNDKEQIIVQKPFGRWFIKYPSPYLVKKGVLKTWMAMEVLSSKGDEAISKVLPYLFQIIKGDKDVFLQKDVDYSDPELQTLLDNFKAAAERYKNEGSKLPANVIPFDQKYEHLIPDLLPILKEELYRQGYRALMAGLGFVDMLEIAQSRQETRLNPKPFIAEINAGVADFKSMLMDVVRIIISQNKIDHRKLFSDKNYLKITNSQLRINVQSILDSIRSGFVYGAITFETYQESLGIDPTQELERMKKEWNDGLREMFYPHVIQNTERDPDTNIKVPTTKKENEKQKEKEKAEEGNIQEDLEIAPYKNVEELLKKHPYMKKYPIGALEVFIEVFNKSLPKGEDYAFPVAYTAMKRWLKKHGYKKINDKWVKSEENK